MKTIGIIAEFNPFHNGHAYLIEKAREYVTAETGEETGIVVCMSGNYVQRGSLAIFDKYTRAMSSLGSADIVFEMPVRWATSDAGNFAMCGVNMLSKLSVDYIAFGVEADGAYSDDGTNTDAASYDSTDLDDISKALLQTSDILSNEPDDYKELLAKNLSQGQSYPAARINALKEYTSSECSYISSPNNILALEYLIAIKKSGSTLKPVFIPRIGSDYNDINTADNFSSASALRKHLIDSYYSLNKESNTYQIGNDKFTEISGKNRKSSDIEFQANVPPSAYEAVNKYLVQPPICDSDILPYITSRLRTASSHDLQNVYGMTEELLNRLNKATYPLSYEALKDHMKTKNVTMTRICRLLLHTALGIEKTASPDQMPNYANLLAMRKSSSKLLRQLEASTDLKIINKKSAYKADDIVSEQSWKIDCRTTDIYNQIVFDKTGIVLAAELSSNVNVV
jgi:Predicted nucleotidyltransferase